MSFRVKVKNTCRLYYAYQSNHFRNNSVSFSVKAGHRNASSDAVHVVLTIAANNRCALEVVLLSTLQ